MLSKRSSQSSTYSSLWICFTSLDGIGVKLLATSSLESGVVLTVETMLVAHVEAMDAGGALLDVVVDVEGMRLNADGMRPGGGGGWAVELCACVCILFLITSWVPGSNSSRRVGGIMWLLLSSYFYINLLL